MASCTCGLPDGSNQSPMRLRTYGDKAKAAPAPARPSTAKGPITRRTWPNATTSRRLQHTRNNSAPPVSVSSRIKPKTNAPTPSNGRTCGPNMRTGGRMSATLWANHNRPTTRASSLGWNLPKPVSIQRRAPLTSMPTPGT